VLLPCLDFALGQSTDPSEGNQSLSSVYILHSLPSCMLLLPFLKWTSSPMELVTRKINLPLMLGSSFCLQKYVMFRADSISLNMLDCVSYLQILQNLSCKLNVLLWIMQSMHSRPSREAYLILWITLRTGTEEIHAHQIGQEFSATKPMMCIFM
jgi:hypothetical protein